MSRYRYSPRLFIINLENKEIKLITIDSCEPDDTIYFFEKNIKYTEDERKAIVIKLRHGHWRERLFDDISFYEVDVYPFMQIEELYADVINGYKKAVDLRN